MSKLILFMGLPCSGKSTYLDRLTGMKIDISSIRKGATGSYKVKGNYNDLVHNLAQRSVHFYLKQNKTVIVDDCFLTEKIRNTYIKIAKKMDKEVELYWFDTPIDTLKARIVERNRIVDEDRKLSLEDIDDLSNSFEFPTKEEGIDFIFYLK